MPETYVTVQGNLTADPELRFLPSGVAVANFTVASTPRVKDGDDWKDGETAFWRVNVWRELAEGASETLRKGSKVLVTGKVQARSWEDKNGGGKRTNMEITADEVGVSVRARKDAGASTGGGWGGASSAAADDAPPF